MNSHKPESAGEAEKKGNLVNNASDADEVMRLNEILAGITASRSWRLTAPLRAFVRIVRAFKERMHSIRPAPVHAPITAGHESPAISAEKTGPALAGMKIANADSIAFGHSDSPLVSLIIPVYNNLTDTLACLQSVSAHLEDIPCEVILADDASDHETIAVLSQIKNLRIIRQLQNKGFLHNCNLAAREAKGRYLHFLNNDTIVTKGWLSALLETMQRSDSIGMAGSKLLFFDGKLQEAGGIIWCNATGLNYGRGDDPGKPEYNYVKEVDYVSGASVLIRRALWEESSGFDALFSPAYFEDTDLAFRLRQKGYKVVYQPASVVYHKECGTYGEIPEGPTRILLETNREKFRLRWERLLRSEKGMSDYNVFLHRERVPQYGRLLFIVHSVPTFEKTGDSASMTTLLNVLNQLGYRIKMLPDDFVETPETNSLMQAGIEVLSGEHYFSSARQWLQNHLDSFDAVIFETPYLLRKYAFIFTSGTQALRICLAGNDLAEFRSPHSRVFRFIKMNPSCSIWAFTESDADCLKSDYSVNAPKVVFPDSLNEYRSLCDKGSCDRLYAVDGLAFSPEALRVFGLHFSSLLQHE